MRAEKPTGCGGDQRGGAARRHVPAQWTATGAGAGVVADNWVVTFNDDQLNMVVAEAIAHNADLRVGAARVEQALLYAKLAGAKLYPSVDLFARGGGKMSGDGSGIQGGGVHRELGARPLGPRPVRPRRGSGRRAVRAGRFRVRAAVDRCARCTELVPGHRGRPAG